jgi:hypothetical protein
LITALLLSLAVILADIALPPAVQAEPAPARTIFANIGPGGFNEGNTSRALLDPNKTMFINGSSGSNSSKTGALNAGGEIMITSADDMARAGSAFLSRRIYSETGFSARFEMRLGPKGANASDGWAFIVARDTNKIGGSSSGLGYSGIPDSFAFLYDTYYNTNSKSENSSSYVPQVQRATNGAYVAVTAENLSSPGSYGSVLAFPGKNLGGAQNYSVYGWVDYSSADQTMSLYISLAEGGTLEKPDTPISVFTGIDIEAVLGNQYFIGFTASNGRQSQILRQFYVFNEYAPDVDFNADGTGLDEGSGAFTEDYTPPTSPVITQQENGMTSTLMLFTVGGSTDQSGVRKYQYRIGDDPAWHDYTDTSGNLLLDGSRALMTPIAEGGSAVVHARALDIGGNISAETSATLKYDIAPGPTLTSPADGQTGIFPESASQLVLSFASKIDASQAGTVTVTDAGSTAANFAGGAVIANDARWDDSFGKLTLPFAQGAIGYGKTYTVTVSGFKNTSGNEMNPTEETFTFSTVAREQTPGAIIDYTNERLTDLTAGTVYRVNGTDYTAAGGSLAIDAAWLGTTIQIVKPGTDTTASSAAQPLPIPARPNAPTGLGSGLSPSRIAGTTTSMEYATSANATSWTSCTAPDTNVNEGTYYVRVKATGSAFHSAAATVEVQATTYTLNASAPVFAPISYGDAQPAAQNLTITSSGNSNAAISSVTSSSADFTITPGTNSVTAGGTNTAYTVQPAESLAVGVHTATITVTYNGNRTATAQVSLTVREQTPVIAIDYTGEQLTGFVPGATYTVNGSVQTASTGRLNIDNAQFGTSLSIVRTNAALSSEAQTLPVPARPGAPTNAAAVDEAYAGEKGGLTGVDATREYRHTGDETWTTGVAGGSVTGLAPGSYQVRDKATDAAFHSRPASLSIAASRNAKVNVTASRPDGAEGGQNGKSSTQYIVLTFDKAVAGLSSSTVEITNDVADVTTVVLKDEITPNTEWHIGLTVNQNNQDAAVKISNWTDAAGDSFTVDGGNGTGFITSNVTVYTGVPETTPGAVIDYEHEWLTGLTPNATYQGNSMTRTADDSGHIAIDPSWMDGLEHNIVKAGGAETTNSAAQPLTIPKRPAMPAGDITDPASESGKGSIDITGIANTDYEYRTLDATDWTPAGTSDGSGDLTIANLDPGVYYVRVKAVASTSFASDSKSFRVHAFDEVDFGSVFVGYDVVEAGQPTGTTAVAPKEITPAGGLTIQTVSWVDSEDEPLGDAPDEFTLTESSGTWTITPAADLDPDADPYKARIKIDYTDDSFSYENVSFWVHPRVEIESVAAGSTKDNGDYKGLTDRLTVTFERPVELAYADISVAGGAVKDASVSAFIDAQSGAQATYTIPVVAPMDRKTGDAITVSIDIGSDNLMPVYHFQYSNGEHLVQYSDAAVTIPRKIESAHVLEHVPGYSSGVIQFTLARGTDNEPYYPIETAALEFMPPDESPGKLALRYASNQAALAPVAIVRIDADMETDPVTGKNDGYTYRLFIVPDTAGAIEISAPGCGIDGWTSVSGEVEIGDSGVLTDAAYFLSSSGRNYVMTLADPYQVISPQNLNPDGNPNSHVYAMPAYTLRLDKELTDWDVEALYVDGTLRAAADNPSDPDPATEFTVSDGGNQPYIFDGVTQTSLTNQLRITLPNGWTDENGTHTFQLVLKNKTTDAYSAAVGKIEISGIDASYVLTVSDNTGGTGNTGGGKYPAGAQIPIAGRAFQTNGTGDETEAFAGWTQAAASDEDGYIAALPADRTGTIAMPAAGAALTANYVNRGAAPTATVTFETESLALPNGIYRFNNGNAVEITEGTCVIDEAWMGTTLEIRRVDAVVGFPIISADSLPQRIEVSARPPAPTDVTAQPETFAAFEDGALANVSSAMEYKEDGAPEWTPVTETTVSPLAPGSYVVRYTATSDAFASVTSEPITVEESTTAPTWGVEMEPSSVTFPGAAYGYGSVTPVTVTVRNTGNQPTGALTVSLGGQNAGSFSLSSESLESLPTGEDVNFTVKPKTGQGTGVYAATVTVSGSYDTHGYSGSFSGDLAASFTVGSQRYALTVVHGTDTTNGGPYAAGAQVRITADAAPTGQVFDRWTSSNGGSFANQADVATTFTMPAKVVTVTATYKDNPNSGGDDPEPPVTDGWVYEDSAWKYFVDGEAITDWLYDASYKAWFYLDSDGIMQTGWLYDHDDKAWYYLAGDGAMKTGWVKDNGSWYYLSGNGAMIAGTWFKDTDGSWYYLSGNGKMLTGKHNISGKAYTFKSNGAWIG